ncbi:MAG: GNAT family N-acetyltransferase [Anaerolineae bacterium]|jgi:ribosomal-protein-alanine N-acetyltransferase
MSGQFGFEAFPVIATQRLRLRQMTRADAPAVLAIFSDPAVTRFLGNPPIATLAEAEALVDWFNAQFQEHAGLRLGITLAGQDTVIGTCGFHRWDRRDHHVEIGYDLGPAYWGRGYATEAVHALVGWCFANLGVHRIEADCVVGNEASERVLRKAGFTAEGVWRERQLVQGRYVDLKQFGLLRQEYEAAQISRTTPSGASNPAGSPPATC